MNTRSLRFQLLSWYIALLVAAFAVFGGFMYFAVERISAAEFAGEFDAARANKSRTPRPPPGTSHRNRWPTISARFTRRN